MKKVNVYYSPVICYEIIKEESEDYSINAYIIGAADSNCSNLHAIIKSFTKSRDIAESFVRALSESAALPIHIPEIAEAFLADI